jgi:hypothetical protein
VCSSLRLIAKFARFFICARAPQPARGANEHTSALRGSAPRRHKCLLCLRAAASFGNANECEPLPAAVSIARFTMIFLSRSWHGGNVSDDVDAMIATIADWC